MIFPKEATEDEKNIDWQQIIEIKDADFGFNTPKESESKIRFCVRILLFNEKEEICVVKSEKYNYLQCFSNRRDLEIARFFKAGHDRADS